MLRTPSPTAISTLDASRSMALSPGMTAYCAFSDLPPETCSHCTGARINVKGYETDYQSGRSTDWFTPQETQAERLSNIQAIDSIATELAAQQPNTGRYNKTKEVYGGNDGMVEFEAVEPDDGA